MTSPSKEAKAKAKVEHPSTDADGVGPQMDHPDVVAAKLAHGVSDD